MESILEKSKLEAFRLHFAGRLLCPGDDDFESARRVWNGMINKVPQVIARCTGVSDVRNAVTFARENNLQVAVRGGGHNVAGNAVCDDGMVIDLSPMKGIRVDPVNRTARAQPGVLWGEFDRETQHFGLATTGGAVSTTGIAGLTLGGGVGWLLGKYGMTCDNLLSADIVTADGEFLTASEDENQDLFWGVRGGGGNFGIATSFKYQLHSVGPILGGVILYPLNQAGDLLHFYREFTANAPDELTAYIAVMTSEEGIPLIAVALCYCGADLKAGERLIKPLRKFGSPVADMIGPVPYLKQQSMLDANVPHGRCSYWKSNTLSELSDDAIDMFISYTANVSSPLSWILIEHHHGEMSRVAPDATAFRHRKAPYDLIILSLWTDPEESDRHIRWSRSFFDAMKPYFGDGVYVNSLSHDEGIDRVRSAYGENYERLNTLKKKFDPENFFHFNQNINPVMV